SSWIRAKSLKRTARTCSSIRPSMSARRLSSSKSCIERNLTIGRTQSCYDGSLHSSVSDKKENIMKVSTRMARLTACMGAVALAAGCATGEMGQGGRTAVGGGTGAALGGGQGGRYVDRSR